MLIISSQRICGKTASSNPFSVGYISLIFQKMPLSFTQYLWTCVQSHCRSNFFLESFLNIM